MAEALASVDAEAANALAAIDHAVATSPDEAQRLCIALGSWFRHRGLLREGVRACEAALAAGPAPSALRARVMSTQAFLLGVQGDFDRSIALARQARDLARDLGDDEAALHALLTAANFQMFTDPPAAAGSLERCLELGLRRQDDWVATRSAMLLATVAWFQQDADRCEAYVVAHRERMEAVGDRQTLALALFAQGGSLYATLDHDRAAALLREAVEVAQETGDPLAEGTLRMVLGRIQIAAGEPRAALENVREVRERLRAVGQFYYLAWAALTEGIAHAACGDLQTARVMLEPIVAGTLGGARNAIVWAQVDLAEVLRLAGGEASRAQATAALAAAEAIGNPWYAAKARLTLGWLSARIVGWREAERLHNEALAAIAERGLRLELPSALEALAHVAAGNRGYEEAARLLGAADRCRRERGPVPWPAHHAEIQTLTRELRDVMGQEDFDRAFAEGEALTDDEALAWARRGWGPRRRPAAGWESLTPAELDVVRHAAAGLTNPEIGEKLFIARATVKAHLSHIYAKLGVSNRTELAALAAEHLRD